MKKRYEGRSRIALLVVGVMIGGMLLTPAGAHVGGTVGHLWKSHLKAKVLKLNYQSRCKDGAVLAHGTIKGAAASFPTTYTTDAAFVTNAYNCKSATNEVRVRRSGTGLYDISLPGISNNASNTGQMVVQVSVAGLCFFTCTDGVVNYIVLPEDGQGQIIHLTVEDAVPSGDADNDGTLIDSDVSFTVYDYS